VTHHSDKNNLRRRQIEGYALGASIQALKAGAIGLVLGVASTLPAWGRISIFAAFVFVVDILNLIFYGLRPWPWYSRWVAEIAFNDSLTTSEKLKQMVRKWQIYAWLVFLVIGVILDRNYWAVNSLRG
jgi:hypothetical protein